MMTVCIHVCVCTCGLVQVIVALSEKSRTHIPYRNSMMTSVLRDRYRHTYLPTLSTIVCVT